MARDISIAISAKDNFTQAITTMRNANSSFNKDLTGLSSKLDALNKNKITIKVDTDKARSALKEAEKQFAATGSAADKMSLELAGANYDNAKRNLDLVSKNARQAEKDILSMTDAVSKSDNRAGSGKSSGGTLGALAQAGITKMVGDTITNVAQTAANSAIGSEGGTLFGSTLSGAATGAAIGSIIPVVGTAIGAAVGAGLGAINGAAQIFSSRDDAFKSVVQDNYSSAKQTQDNALSSGTTIAGNREQNQISFTTMLGSSGAAKDFLSGITDFAAKTPFEYDQLTSISKTLLAYGYKQNQVLPLLTKVGDTGSALGMSGDDMNAIATGLGRMQNSGKTTLEYLNPLLERGIPVWDYLAKASGKTKEQVQEMVSKGLVPGGQAAKALADYMGDANKGSMDLQSHTYIGLQSSLKDAQDTLDAAMGNGYNDERKQGIQAQMDWLGGESGAKMQDAYKMIGSWKASLDNDQETAIRHAMNDTIDSAAYKIAAQKDDRVTMGKLLAEAQVKGENAYKASDGYQLQIKSDLDLASSIREDTSLKSEYWNTGYNMGQEFSKGLAETAAKGIQASLNPNGKTVISGTGKSETTGTAIGAGGNRGSAPPINQYPGRPSNNATGIFRVPYNNFPALLHEDEEVRTGVEARSSKNTQTVTITGNSFVVREDADIDKIARALVEKLSGAAMIS